MGPSYTSFAVDGLLVHLIDNIVAKHMSNSSIYLHRILDVDIFPVVFDFRRDLCFPVETRKLEAVARKAPAARFNVSDL